MGIDILSMREGMRKRPLMFLGSTDLHGHLRMLRWFLNDLPLQDAHPVMRISFYSEQRIVIRLEGIDRNAFTEQLQSITEEKSIWPHAGALLLTTMASAVSIAVTTGSSPFYFFGEHGAPLQVLVSSAPRMIAPPIHIEHTADPAIFGHLEFHRETINRFFQEYAILNPGWKLVITDRTHRLTQRSIHHYPGGILQRFDERITMHPVYDIGNKLRFTIEASADGYTYRIGVLFSSLWQQEPRLQTFAGQDELHEGGSLENGILEGIIATIRALAEEHDTPIRISRKLLRANLFALATIDGDNFVFYGATKWRLDMPKVRRTAMQLVQNELGTLLKADPEAAEKLLARFIDHKTYLARMGIV